MGKILTVTIPVADRLSVIELTDAGEIPDPLVEVPFFPEPRSEIDIDVHAFNEAADEGLKGGQLWAAALSLPRGKSVYGLISTFDALDKAVMSYLYEVPVRIH